MTAASPKLRIVRGTRPGRPLARHRSLPRLLALAVLGLALSATSPHVVADERPEPASPAAEITADDVRPHIEFLASPPLAGRGSPATKRLAADYVLRQWRNSGWKPLFGDSYEQVIPATVEAPPDAESLKSNVSPPTSNPPPAGTPEASDPSPSEAGVRGINLGAWLPGTSAAQADELIVIGAHYDHLGVRGNSYFPGADDNASGMAMLLEVGHRLAEGPRLERSVVLLAFDLEEQMLWGSNWFAAHPPWPIERVKLFITADMIGRSLADLPLNTVFVMGAERGRGLKDFLKQADTPAGLELGFLGADLIGSRSDYAPFRDRKIPFLFFSTGEHRDYHAPTDVAAKVNFPQVARVSQFVLRICRTAGQASELPEWVARPEPDLDEVRTLYRVTGLLLECDPRTDNYSGRARLTSVQRFTVSNVHQQAGRILAIGKVTAEDRPWLIRSAQLLMLTVF